MGNGENKVSDADKDVMQEAIDEAQSAIENKDEAGLLRSAANRRLPAELASRVFAALFGILKRRASEAKQAEEAFEQAIQTLQEWQKCLIQEPHVAPRPKSR